MKKWDVFISYASEDRETVARPLAMSLRELGVSVWFDQTELGLGDSLRLKVDEGLANCRYGIVILSKCFFGKHYPERELNGLAQREIDDQDVILPIWHGVDEEDVRAYSPPLADRIAEKWEHGVHIATFAILKVVRPDIVEDINARKERDTRLPRIRTGSELGRLLGTGDSVSFLNDDPDANEVSFIAGFLDELRDWGEVLDVNGPGKQVEANASMHAQIKELNESGWSVYGKVQHTKKKIGGKSIPWEEVVIAIVKGDAECVIQLGNDIIKIDNMKSES